jgi:DNA-binding GntR family transcriptional regulator
MRYSVKVSSETIGHEDRAEAAAPRANTRLAYDAIRARIVDGEVAPGQWLRESTVADSLGLSRTPVREALRMLATEGVIEMVPNRGARVVSWTPADIDEVYRLRALLEGHGAALAARAATPQQVPRGHSGRVRQSALGESAGRDLIRPDGHPGAVPLHR